MIEVPARFNATTFFVDRHVVEGRGAKVAFFHDEGSITYAGLQELVDERRIRGDSGRLDIDW